MRKSVLLLIVILGLTLLVVSPAVAATVAPNLNRIEIYNNNNFVGYNDLLSTETYPSPIPVAINDKIIIRVQATANTFPATLTVKDPTGLTHTYNIPQNSKTTNDVNFNVNWASGSKSFDCSITDSQGNGQVFTGGKSFRIVAANVITVTSPNGGETWAQKSTHLITWTSSGDVGSNVKIDLLKAGSVFRTLANTLNDGSCSWTLLNAEGSGTDYQVRITSSTNSAITDSSDGYFTIVPEEQTPSITVTSPNGGETWAQGTTHDITWTSSGDVGSYYIEVLKAGRVVQALSYNTMSSVESWQISGGYTAPGSDYQIRVTSTTNHAITDSSDNYFTISPAVTIASPNGGESWFKGTTNYITWSSTGGAYKIDLLKAGVVIQTLSSGATGSMFTWTIPTGLATGSDYQIRLTSTTNPLIADTSDNYFTITSAEQTATITVTSPNGGETWQRGKTHTVMWDYTGDPGPYVKFTLFQRGNEVETIYPISTGSNGKGSYSWSIVPTGTVGSNFQVRIESRSQPTVVDTSNSFFLVSATAVPSITIMSPNGGESWVQGTTKTIGWSSSGEIGSYVKIELLKGNSVVQTISTSTISNIENWAYHWTIPTTLAAGSDYRIRITSTTNPSIMDLSDNYFSIVSSATVQPPVAAFTTDISSGTPPLSVRFTDTSTGGSPTLWNWRFGDGTSFSTSLFSERNPTHTYRTAGTYTAYLVASNSAGQSTSTSRTITVATTTAGTHISIYRPSTGNWYMDTTRTGIVVTQFHFGANRDIPIVGDWNADDITDVGVFRQSNGNWYLSTTKSGTVNMMFHFGASGDIPVVGDWDGNGVSDVGVFRPASGNWYLDTTRNGVVATAFHFGTSGDIPITGDWDGNGVSDVGVFRPASGNWYLDTTGNGVVATAFHFGANGDIPIVGDWNADGITDVGVFRQSNGNWYLSTTKSGTVNTMFHFGTRGDIPIVGDWDGNGVSDVGVFRPSTGNWYLDTTKNGVVVTTFHFGKSGDIPAIGKWI